MQRSGDSGSQQSWAQEGGLPRWGTDWARTDSNQELDRRQVNDPETCSEEEGEGGKMQNGGNDSKQTLSRATRG